MIKGPKPQVRQRYTSLVPCREASEDEDLFLTCGPRQVAKADAMCLDFTKGTQYKHWLYKDTETLGKSGEAASAHEARSHSAAHLKCLCCRVHSDVEGQDQQAGAESGACEQERGMTAVRPLNWTLCRCDALTCTACRPLFAAAAAAAADISLLRSGLCLGRQCRGQRTERVSLPLSAVAQSLRSPRASSRR